MLQNGILSLQKVPVPPATSDVENNPEFVGEEVDGPEGDNEQEEQHWGADPADHHDEIVAFFLLVNS